MDREIAVADAVLKVLAEAGDADISAGLGWIFQEPLDERAIELKRKIGIAAIAAANT